MKVLQIFNESRARFGGEPAVVETTMRILARHGHEAQLLVKSSRVLQNSPLRQLAAFWGGIYNVVTYREMRARLRSERPDVVHVHGLYPMFSPSVLVACRREKVPVVMTVHNQSLTCPTAFHLYRGSICEDCLGGREYRCITKNCRENLLESTAYALRSSVARRFRLFHDNVNVFIALTPFTRQRLLQAGFADSQIAVLPNAVDATHLPTDPPLGAYVAFAGRVSAEKGVDVLLSAAEKLDGIPVKIAGDGPLLAELSGRAPKNVEFVGRLGAGPLSLFYRNARMVVVPSICFEQFPMSAMEGMAHAKPVIGSRIGGIPYMVDEGSNGLLFAPSNAGELAEKIRSLWDSPQRCQEMGAAAQNKVRREYSEEIYFRNLMAAYEKAIKAASHPIAASPLVTIRPAPFSAPEAPRS